MKQLFFLLMTLSILSFTTSCSNSDKKEGEEHKHGAMYQCPMKCEDDKMYDEPGKCPKCNMDLEAIESEHNHEH